VTEKRWNECCMEEGPMNLLERDQTKYQRDEKKKLCAILARVEKCALEKSRIRG